MTQLEKLRVRARRSRERGRHDLTLSLREVESLLEEIDRMASQINDDSHSTPQQIDLIGEPF